MKIGIYDDVPEFNEMICHACRAILEKWNYDCETVMYGSESELMQEVYELDILLLDIKLPDSDGIEIKQNLEQMGVNVLIIFVTFYTSKAASAFGIHVCGFVDKDHLEEDLEKYLIPALQSLTHFVVLEQGVSSRQVRYIESSRVYSILHLADGSSVETRTPLREYEKMLSKFNFVRTHKSFLVNLHYVDAFAPDHMMVSNEARPIPISFRLRTQIKRILLKLHIEEVRKQDAFSVKKCEIESGQKDAEQKKEG